VIWILLSVAVVAMSGGLLVGFTMGLRYAAARADLRRPPAPHEALARVYTMPAPADILAELRGPLKGKGPA
jgi:hypothetical protein